MIPGAISWFLHRYRPKDGWLAAVLMFTITLTVAYQLAATNWVPEGGIAWISLISFALVMTLYQGQLGWRPAWLIITGYGLVLTTLWLGSLWPPRHILFGGWGMSASYIRQNWSLLVARFEGWLEAASTGASSQETIVFAFGLGLLAWLVIALATWQIFRRRQAIAGLLLIGLAMAFNGFYGQAPLAPMALFAGLSVMLVATLQLGGLQDRWEKNGVDYPTDIQFDLLTSGAAVGMFIMALSFFVPEVNIRAVYRALLDRPAVHQLEESLERVFAGVQLAGDRESGVGRGGSAAGRGLPRSFLLGDAPELYETVVFTATVMGDTPGVHWRGTSYDVYTGRGWAISEENPEFVPARERLAQPEVTAAHEISQSLIYAQDNQSLRLSLGLPLEFDQDVETYWRPPGDLIRVIGQGREYSVLSQVVEAPSEQLRAAINPAMTAEFYAHYTYLPESVPGRVHQLAIEIAAGLGDGATMYDLARGIESFLRQYPYSLEVTLPPSGSDPVDYFLFEAQSGYCDYYASAMVVLARSLGLPARLATGYQPQEVGANGQQTIFQINAHSWAEVYFEGFGWVEFEPTAGFTLPLAPIANDQQPLVEGEPVNFQPPPIPEDGNRWLVLLWLLVPLAVAGGIWLLWRRNQQKWAVQEEVQRIYGWLLHGARRLGQETPASQTPAEFEHALLSRLSDISGLWLVKRLSIERLSPDIQQLTQAFVLQQYAQDKRATGSPMVSWRRMRRRYWLLGQLLRLSQLWARLR